MRVCAAVSAHVTLASAPLAPVTLNVAWPTQFLRAIAPRNSGMTPAPGAAAASSRLACQSRRRSVYDATISEAVGSDLRILRNSPAFPLFRLGSTDETNSLSDLTIAVASDAAGATRLPFASFSP